MAAHSRDRQMTTKEREWTWFNKFLLVVSLVMLAVVAYCGYFVARRQQLSGDFVETDCTIVGISLGKTEECKKCTILHSFCVNISNDRFDRMFDLCDSSTFPCLTIKAQYAVQLGGAAGQKTIQARLHENAQQMDEFPKCSYTRCHNNSDVNRQQVETFANHMESVMNSSDVVRCYYNPNQPLEVVLGRKFTLADAVLSVFFPSLAAITCILAVVLRKTYRAYQQQCCKVSPADVTTTPPVTQTEVTESDFEEMEPFREADPTQKLPPVPDELRTHRGRKLCLWTVQPMQPPAYRDVVPRDIFSPPPPYEDAVVSNPSSASSIERESINE